MEKLTIKPWQVMRAHENGAKIEVDAELAWLYDDNPSWNFKKEKYRIADLTADGMRLDELVEKFQEKIELLFDLSVKNELLTFGKSRCNTEMLIKFLLLYPECIAQVKVKQEKKLRPWTMAEFEKHKDEWFTWLDGEQRKILSFGNGYVRLYNIKNETSMKVFLKEFTREDGSPCGVFE